MGVSSVTYEYPTSIPASRLFKALQLDGHKLYPKILPEFIKSIDVQGEGVGSIRVTNFAEGSPYKHLKHRVDALDTDNYYCKYVLVEGGMIGGDILESMVQEFRYEPAGAGSVFKITIHYHTKGDTKMSEEVIKGGKEASDQFFKAGEQYLLANPGAYA